jgi:pyridoxamine 5'-phosphate oxidase family protein
MSVFTEAELDFLRNARLLARIATVDPGGNLHVTPVGWRLSEDDGVIEVGGKDFARTKKYRDVARTGRAAIVIDEVLEPWRPRGVEVRGSAEAVEGPDPKIRIRAERIVGWGLDGNGRYARNANDN